MHNFWSPWHGCKKCSPGCLNCYVYYLDKIHHQDASIIRKSLTNFDLPLKKNRKGEFKIPSGTTVATCFTSDFFLEEADKWRAEAWQIIKKRPDLTFLICTKRIERFMDCIPPDWGKGYPNVILAVTCENNEMASIRLPIFLKIPAQAKQIFVGPILEYVDLKPYLKTGKISLVSVSGESYENARPCDFSWVEKIYKDCLLTNTPFSFHQTGSNFIMHGKTYKIKHHEEYHQAQKGEEYLKKHFKNP